MSGIGIGLIFAAKARNVGIALMGNFVLSSESEPSKSSTTMHSLAHHARRERFAED